MVGGRLKVRQLPGATHRCRDPGKRPRRSVARSCPRNRGRPPAIRAGGRCGHLVSAGRQWFSPACSRGNPDPSPVHTYLLSGSTARSPKREMSCTLSVRVLAISIRRSHTSQRGDHESHIDRSCPSQRDDKSRIELAGRRLRQCAQPISADNRSPTRGPCHPN